MTDITIETERNKLGLTFDVGELAKQVMVKDLMKLDEIKSLSNFRYNSF